MEGAAYIIKKNPDADLTKRLRTELTGLKKTGNRWAFRTEYLPIAEKAICWFASIQDDEKMMFTKKLRFKITALFLKRFILKGAFILLRSRWIFVAKQPICRLVFFNGGKPPDRLVKAIVFLIVVTHGDFSEQNGSGSFFYCKIMV